VGKREMKLLSMIKSVCVMIGFAVASDGWAMDLVTYKDSPEKFVREFPLMTLQRATFRYNRCSGGDKAMIDKIIVDKKDECLSMIFFMATKNVNDNRRIILGLSFNDNQAVINKFLKMPIKDIWELYGWAQEAHEGKLCPYFNSLIKKKNLSLTVTDFIQFSDGIALVDKHYYDVTGLPLTTIKTLNDFFSVGSIGPIVRKKFTARENCFNYYKTYTLANSSSAFNEIFYDKSGEPTWDMFCMKILSPGIVASLLLRLVELNFFHKDIDSTIVLNNERRRVLNDVINKSEFAELLSDYLKPIKNPMSLSISSYLKLSGITLLSYLILGWQPCFFGNIHLLGGFSLFYIGLMLLRLYLSLHSINDRVLLVGSAICLSFMAVYIIIWTVVQMQQLKSETISWDKIPELLKKHDDGHMVIQ